VAHPVYARAIPVGTGLAALPEGAINAQGWFSLSPVETASGGITAAPAHAFHADIIVNQVERFSALLTEKQSGLACIRQPGNSKSASKSTSTPPMPTKKPLRWTKSADAILVAAADHVTDKINVFLEGAF